MIHVFPVPHRDVRGHACLDMHDKRGSRRLRLDSAALASEDFEDEASKLGALRSRSVLMGGRGWVLRGRDVRPEKVKISP